MTQRTYASAENLKGAHTALCEQWLEECGTTKESIAFVAHQFKTKIGRFSRENLDRQIKRLEKGKQLKIEFNKLLAIQEEIELIKSMLKGNSDYGKPATKK